MLDETTLLRRYVENADEDAFTEIVRQRVDFVHSAALRQVGRDAHLAQDVTQGVFLALARSARSLAGRPSLSGWLYTTTRFLAAKAVRSHRRWQAREKETQTMNETGTTTAGDPNWEELRPVLDGAMHELGARDREAILLRYFENRPYTEIAAACGVNENAARMRVERALDRLRDRLTRRGVTSTAAVLGLVLSTQTVVPAPVGLAATAAQFSFVGASGAGTGIGGVEFMAVSKAKIAAVSAFVLAGSMGGFFVGEHFGRSESQREPLRPGLLSEDVVGLPDENQRLRRAAAERERQIPLLQAASSRVSDGEQVLTPSNEEMLASLRALSGPRGQPPVDGGVGANVAFIDRRGRVTEGFVALFRLTEQEGMALQNALDEVKRQLNGAASASATVSRDEKGRVVIDVPPIDGGADLYDRFFDSFARTLGAERNTVFFKLAAPQVEQMLYNFGGEQRRFVVSPPSPRPDGTLVYGVSFDRKHATGSSTGSRGYSREELDDIFGSLAKFVPVNF